VSDVLDAIIWCDGEQLILTSDAIFSHMQQCVPIAKLESGESVENSLIPAPDWESSVKSKIGKKEITDMKEGGKKEGRRKGDEEEEGTELEGGEDGRTEDNLSDAGSLGAVSVSGATAALLLLNASKSRRCEFPSAGLDE